MGWEEVHSQVRWLGCGKIMPAKCKPTSRASSHLMPPTCYDLWTLKVFIGMKIAWRQRKIDADQQQQQVAAPPHCLTICYLSENVSGLLIAFLVEVGWVATSMLQRMTGARALQLASTRVNLRDRARTDLQQSISPKIGGRSSTVMRKTWDGLRLSCPALVQSIRGRTHHQPSKSP